MQQKAVKLSNLIQKQLVNQVKTSIRLSKKRLVWETVSVNSSHCGGPAADFMSLSSPSDYEALQLQANQTSSGDSFYIRVNVSLAAGSGGALSVSCNDVLHVTNTRPAGAEDQWFASQVHPCQLLDLQRGTVPNYYRLVLRRWGRPSAQSQWDWLCFSVQTQGADTSDSSDWRN